ncbi:MAG: radical SAM protein, partial [Dehalococcoidales bacterium]|nr:radical SAM protein [Dehalococcoidales bacterium]
KDPGEFEFKPPVYKRTRIDEAVDYLADADIVFFSAYVWNYRISLEIAKSIKQRKNSCVTVFGGPQVPESAEGMKAFLANNPFIDIACYGGGEIAALKILENLKNRSWSGVASIGFISNDGNFKYNSNNDRIEDINTIPSPYLDGVFDPLMQANPDENWSALIETNRGCPYACAYCYWGTQERSRVSKYDMERVLKEIDWISRHKILFSFCCDANFGIFERDVDIAGKVAENKRKYGYPEAFSVQNTKNSTKRIFRLQKILNDAGLQKGVNLALQSVDEGTLKNIDRDNISNSMFKDLQKMFTKGRIPTFSDIIIALPGESYDTFVKGVNKVIENGQHNRIQFINLAVLANTRMAEPAYQQKYGLLTKELKAIPHHANLEEAPEIYEAHNIVIGTNSMTKEDWVKTKVFCWMVSLLYFDKLLQIPSMLLNKACRVSYSELNEAFTSAAGATGELSGILRFFIDKAGDIQNGGTEYVASKEWLNTWWPADEYLFIKLCREGLLQRFYDEAEETLNNFIKQRNLEFSDELLREAVRLNKDLIKLPFIKSDLDVSLSYNIPEIYEGLLRGKNISLKKGSYTYRIDRTSNKWLGWDDWMREVVWYGTKKGDYLYSCQPVKNDSCCCIAQN